MNSENLLRVADAIENHEIEWLGFNMDDFCAKLKDRSGHNCGTTACIAGWTIAISKEIKSLADLENFCPCESLSKVAGSYLGLNYFESKNLFYKFFVNSRPVTPEMAVRTLRYAAKHGVIAWDAAQLMEAEATS